MARLRNTRILFREDERRYKGWTSRNSWAPGSVHSSCSGQPWEGFKWRATGSDVWFTRSSLVALCGIVSGTRGHCGVFGNNPRPCCPFSPPLSSFLPSFPPPLLPGGNQSLALLTEAPEEASRGQFCRALSFPVPCSALLVPKPWPTRAGTLMPC